MEDSSCLSLISSIPATILSAISDITDGCSLYRLYATGDSKIRFLMLNGGVTTIRFARIFFDLRTETDSCRGIPSTFWMYFMNMMHLEFGTGCPLQLAIIQHSQCENLISLKIDTHAPTHPWNDLMSLISRMPRLQKLWYNVEALPPPPDYSLSDFVASTPTSVILPINIMMSLVDLTITIPSTYNIGDLPHFLTSFHGFGSIVGLSRLQDQFHDDGSFASMVGLTGIFPQTLTYLNFTFSNPSAIFHKDDPFEVLSMENFIVALPHSLVSLRISALLHEHRELDDLISNLPPHVEHLNLRIANCSDTFRFSNLPKCLKSFYNIEPFFPLEKYPVSLPSSLTKIEFASYKCLDLSKWMPYVIFPNPNLRIMPLLNANSILFDTDAEKNGFLPTMVSGCCPSNHRNAHMMAVYCTGLKYIRYDAEDANPENLILISNSCLNMNELNIMLPTSELFDFAPAFSTFPSQLTTLGIVGHTASLNCLPLAHLLPHITKFYHSASPIYRRYTSSHSILPTFEPLSLPPLLEELTISSYTIDVKWLLSNLSPHIKTCSISGCHLTYESDYLTKPGWMPRDAGSLHEFGWTLELDCIVSRHNENGSTLINYDDFGEECSSNRNLTHLEFSIRTPTCDISHKYSSCQKGRKMKLINKFAAYKDHYAHANKCGIFSNLK